MHADAAAAAAAVTAAVSGSGSGGVRYWRGHCARGGGGDGGDKGGGCEVQGARCRCLLSVRTSSRCRGATHTEIKNTITEMSECGASIKQQVNCQCWCCVGSVVGVVR